MGTQVSELGLIDEGDEEEDDVEDEDGNVVRKKHRLAGLIGTNRSVHACVRVFK